VAYDGTEFHGFQLQKGVATIQGELEAALSRVTAQPVRISGAGRTDSGVHASGQVIATEVSWRHTIADLQRAWNAYLPPSIAVRGLQIAPASFHPRFSALDRTYQYTVVLASDLQPWAPHRSPLTDRFALYLTDRLDLAAMNRAAQFLLGEHDFATFGQAPTGDNTVRVVYEAEWRLRKLDPAPLSIFPGQQYVFSIRANAFLYQMVRSLVGVLLQVGQGRWSLTDFADALQARDRARCAPPVPPQGLVLERIGYPVELGLQFDGKIGAIES
jgi:tRNA pseudouridine38-40 synthase